MDHAAGRGWVHDMASHVVRACAHTWLRARAHSEHGATRVLGNSQDVVVGFMPILHLTTARVG
eukprot:8167540-Alexandrium_andersonii.AAC.1